MLVSIIYTIGIKDMLIRYIHLVSEGLTLKEKVSRQETCMTYGMKDEMKLKLTSKQKFKNFISFIFKRRNHKSNLPHPL